MNDRVPDSERCLAIETSGRMGGVAIGSGSRVLEVASFGAELRHAVELLPTIDRLCRDHGFQPDSIDELYVSAGPGSFTGLRIGLTVARMLAWAGGVSVVRVPTLDVVAQNALEVDETPPHVAALLDAKRDRVYAATYGFRNDRYHRLAEPAEHEPCAFFATLPPGCALIGEGVGYVADAVRPSGLTVLPERTFRARAEVVYRLGRLYRTEIGFDPIDRLVPIYVRRPEAEEVWDRRHGKDVSRSDRPT